MKWRINYWYRDGSRIYRGHDIVEAPEDFDELEAEDMLDDIAIGSTVSEPREIQDMNFFKNYCCADNPCTFKVLSVRRVF